MIVEIRDTPVILANDLATFYATKTKQINQYRERNAERFLPDYALQFTNDEWQRLKLQNVPQVRNIGVAERHLWHRCRDDAIGVNKRECSATFEGYH